ncbi:hypothetical protein [Clostridium saccharoperbutylacetonicum]|uniref:hypothetical protein n=1 Tax=Clostridium saccharoperbutylacetonicum TaxID=36745 RepID=UPI0039EC3A0F
MKITNRILQSKVQILSMISNKQLPVKVSYSLAKNIAVINKELKLFEEEKVKIIGQYALKDENGNPKIENNKYIFENDEKENECNEKYNELLDIEAEIELRGIKESELLNANINFTPAELIELDFMIME